MFMPFGPATAKVGGVAFYNTPAIGLLVINKTGTAIAKDKVVALSGLDTTSLRPKIVLADADDPSHSQLYVTTAAIANGAQGYVYKGGMSAANLNTNSATAAGDPVYLSQTAGGFVHTAPIDAAGGVKVIGFVTVKSATVGQIHWNTLFPWSHGGGVRQSRQRISTANVNAGATLIAAPGAGYKLRLIDCIAIAIGGNAGTVTTVDILGTQSAGSVKLVAFGQAQLTRSTVLRPGITGATVLADGASFVANDANTAITIGKTGGSLDTATNIDVILSYAVDPA